MHGEKQILGISLTFIELTKLLTTWVLNKGSKVDDRPKNSHNNKKHVMF